MKLWLVIIHIILVGTNLWATAHYNEELTEDNEFAEFEDFEDEKSAAASEKFSNEKKNINSNNINNNDNDMDDNNQVDQYEEDDTLVEDDVDSEFDHFQDEEEFEGLENKSPGKSDEPSTLTITKVPLHLRARWDSYYLEILMVAGLIIYFINYFTGCSKNCRIAESWFAEHRKILQDNFSLVGDTGKSIEESSESCLVKESESQYSIYCSGRVGCDSLLIELKLLKRQDLINVIAQILRPQNDQTHLKIELAKDETDNFVFAVATKRTAVHFIRDIADIATYCPDKRPGEKFGLPPGFYVMSEIAEATPAILDTRVVAAFNKYSQFIDYIHVSDQYSGTKQQEDSGALTMPEVKRVLLIGLNISIKGKISNAECVEKMRALLQLTFYLVDKLRRFKLSKEGKSKADKNRQKVEEAFLKTTHAARAEAAAAKREEKRRQEKERILQEEDPDKQRKWEEKEQKRLAKKRAPRMKQLKVKAL
ncbi:PAT complex subunit CCDC47 isoform X2 [Microplitis demolitor]|uniref:PAT complex subunit CCDC47 isoform X2 n=1 Tax=Microplitis demolitor TaxID=69319 RepID=UPI0004CCED38|nr:PAT complex subunit CCDC47 isoform X2 [Microplitis demolitor]XP_053598781.1 PAT complex subunit CCDC47 isoform X2 [Microplitis demolitor]